jgi:hypothetical protein
VFDHHGCVPLDRPVVTSVSRKEGFVVVLRRVVDSFVPVSYLG